ncbi:MAG: hypothetical protein ABI680_11255, partial [Chthoniobacteraceae bacterium]
DQNLRCRSTTGAPADAYEFLNAPPSNPARALALGIAGAALGGGAGYFIFMWIARQGFYALILPPALLGLGAGWLARQRSVPLATVCTIAGIALALFCEWRFAPFAADHSLGYFVTHLPDLRPITLIMAALGGYFSYRLSLVRETR